MSMDSPFGLAGKRVLVTGGGSGIGKAISRCMIEAGAEVLIAGRRAEVLADAALELGEACHTAVFDIADLESIAKFEASIAADFGPIDILVNNAGGTIKRPFEDSNLAEFDQVFDVHVRGALELTRQVIKRQLLVGSGKVLFIASMTSFIGQPNVMPYTVAKTAVTGAVRGLSAEFARRGVTVNAVAPGWIDTELFREATDADPKRKERIMARIQTGALGEPADIGWACVFLASPAGKYITGQTLIVDGGGVIGF